MQSHNVMRQMPGQPGRAGRRHGEAGSDTASDETGGTLHEHLHTGSAKSKAGTGGLLEAALTRQKPGAARAVLTSNSRTARCGPACRVVWQGRLPSGRPPMPMVCSAWAQTLFVDPVTRLARQGMPRHLVRAGQLHLKKCERRGQKLVFTQAFFIASEPDAD